jgi:hypothetical protein
MSHAVSDLPMSSTNWCDMVEENQMTIPNSCGRATTDEHGPLPQEVAGGTEGPTIAPPVSSGCPLSTGTQSRPYLLPVIRIHAQ